MRVHYGFFDSPLGRMLVASTETGVCAVRFGEADLLLAELQREFARAVLLEAPAAVAAHAAAIAAHLAGKRPSLELPLDVAASPFQRRVWELLCRIPRGETRSYSELARLLGEPKAVRAVARACATNPVAVLVPCHRVVRTDGELAGYRWGLERKRALLALEQQASVH